MTKTKLVGVVVAAVAAFGVWHGVRGGGDGGSEAMTDSENRLVVDRIWIDHLPKSETDTVQVFLALAEEPVGLFNQSSMWAGRYEMFRYEQNQGTFRVVYPQTRERESFAVRARSCKDVADMDYCLDIKGSSRGVARYSSRKGFEIGAGGLVGAMAAVTGAIEQAATHAE